MNLVLTQVLPLLGSAFFGALIYRACATAARIVDEPDLPFNVTELSDALDKITQEY